MVHLAIVLFMLFNIKMSMLRLLSIQIQRPGWLQILNYTTYPSDAILEIIDLNGNNLISKNVSFEKGTNLLDVDISMLSNGAYFIRITDSKTQTIKSIIKS
jgi:hypothetical protein